MNRPVVPGCAGCAMTHPDFGRSVNPISTRGVKLCPPNYYWHPRIFRPSDGPGRWFRFGTVPHSLGVKTKQDQEKMCVCVSLDFLIRVQPMLLWPFQSNK